EQASHKPQRKKPRRTSRPLRKQWGFECSAVRSWRRCRHVAVARARWTPLVSEAACTLVMAVSASLDGEAAHDAAVRYREVAMDSGQSRDGHAAARDGGGPRIDCPRAKAS